MTTPPPPPTEAKLSTDPTMMASITELSSLLDTGLDVTSLRTIVEMIEMGCDPESLSRVVIELKKKSEKKRNNQRGEKSSSSGYYRT